MISQLYQRTYWDWETEARGPRRATMLDLREVEVSAVKGDGFKTTDGNWLNWSRFREPSAYIMPSVGDVARVGLDSKGFIRQLSIVAPEPAPAPRAIAGGAPAPAAPAPRVEAEPDWFTGQAPAPAERVVLAGGLETDDRGRAIARMNAITSATAILSSGGGAATLAEVLDVAARLEAWIFR